MQRLGYSKDDMVAMLLMLDTLNNRTGSWWEHISADHADPKERAAQIAADPRVMKALMSFDVGLAFMDNRKWALAMRFFEEAQEREPQLFEAQVNAAQCSLMIYYDLLAFKLRESWLRPDFGPMLVRSVVTTRGDEAATDEDRKRYKTALAKAQAAATATGTPRANELLALVRVLEPDADQDVVSKGVEAFKTMAAGASDEILRMRYANNLCVGLHRLGQLNAGYLALMDAQRKTKYFNYALAENLGRITVSERSKEDEQIALNVMFTWLKRSQSITPYWEAVNKNYAAACGRLNLVPNKIEAAPVVYCKAIALRVGGREYGLFRPVEEYRDGLGAPDATVSFSDRYPDLTEMRWRSGSVTIFTERGRALRLTTYEAASSLFLQPIDRSVSGGFTVQVGMSVADLKKFLDPDSGEEIELAKGGDLETWTYWSGLNMGLLIADGKVKGITVTAVAGE